MKPPSTAELAPMRRDLAERMAQAERLNWAGVALIQQVQVLINDDREPENIAALTAFRDAIEDAIHDHLTGAAEMIRERAAEEFHQVGQRDWEDLQP